MVKGDGPRGKTVWAKAPLLDAAAQNGVNSSTFSAATWWLWGLVGGFCVVLFCKETKRDLCESAETVCNFFGEPVLMEQKRHFLDVSFEGPFRGPPTSAS